MALRKAAEKKKVATTDYEEATSGAMAEIEEDKEAKKSEMPSLDDEHISHPRPEEGEEEQSGSEKSEASEKNKEEEEDELESEASSERDAESLKSLTPGDLAKSIKKLSELVQDKSPSMRKSALLAKASKGTELSKSENKELYNLLGTREVRVDLAKSITSNIAENEAIKEALDVSNYLGEQHKELIKSLSTVGSFVEKNSSRQYELTSVLAKAVIDTGMLVKSLCEKVDSFSSQPARGPKSVGVNAVKHMEKSFAGVSQETGNSMSKSQVMDTLETMVTDAMSKGNKQAADHLGNALISYESSNQLNADVAQAVRNFVKNQ